MSDQEQNVNGRREFIKTLAVAGGAGAAVAVAGQAVAEEAEVETEASAKGYQKTAHVRAYYKTARL